MSIAAEYHSHVDKHEYVKESLVCGMVFYLASLLLAVPLLVCGAGEGSIWTVGTLPLVAPASFVASCVELVTHSSGAVESIPGGLESGTRILEMVPMFLWGSLFVAAIGFLVRSFFHNVSVATSIAFVMGLVNGCLAWSTSLQLVSSLL